MQRRSRVAQRQRASRACDFCHSRGLKCRRPCETADRHQEKHTDCLTCVDYGAQCTMDRPIRKRGRKPTVSGSRTPTRKQSGPDSDCRFPSDIQRLLNVYHDTMYQCYFPFLSENDLMMRWADGMPNPNGPSYLLLMAICAVSSQSVALKAVFDKTLLEGLPVHDSAKYLVEAVSKIPVRIPESQDLDYLRAFGLLAVYSLRRGNKSDLHRYLGLYHGLVAQHGFHDESHWPNDISLSEVDDRRRLFWCVYRLEIHSACVLGHMVRMPESQVSVLYPRITPAMDPETQAWTAGWDYITDLFRLLEYAVSSLRQRKPREAVFAVFCDRPCPRVLLESLARLKAGKPRVLRNVTRSDGGLQSDRCKYMAVQITCTEALINIMGLLHCQAPANEVVGVATEFLNEITGAALIMFKVASSQIIHQLLGVGHMVYNAFRYDTQSQFEAGRVVAYLGDLVKNLEQHPHSS